MMLLVSGSTRSVARAKSASNGRLGVLLTPQNGNCVASVLATGLPWAVDNGAFGGFHPVAYLRLLDRIMGKPRCLWVAAPDVVGDAQATLCYWEWWQHRIRSAMQRVAFVLQDGQENIGEPPEADAYFIGGSTSFKLSQASADLSAWVKAKGKWLHMGRVNSKRRMVAALDRGCDSIDGSSASKFGDTYIRKYLNWIDQLKKQPVLFDS